MIRLLCVTVYVFNKTGDKALFMNHRKLNKLMPPGGKVDPNELPDVAAVREALEETGLHITLVGEKTPVDGCLMRPYGTQLNHVIPGEKDHIDLIYAAVADEHEQTTLSEREASDLAWISIDDIGKPDFNTFKSVKQWVALLSPEIKKYAHMTR